MKIWQQLRSKWTELDSKGHKLKIDFQLIAHPVKKNEVLAIDVIQHIDGKPVTETVQREAGEAYPILGIDKLSQESLTEVFKGMMGQLRSQSEPGDVDLVVIMSPTSSTSGQMKGYLVVPDAPVQTPVLLNFQHYYVLSALRDKMMESSGKQWQQVRAVYHLDDLKFYFGY